jgi:hypothetical protein
MARTAHAGDGVSKPRDAAISGECLADLPTAWKYAAPGLPKATAAVSGGTSICARLAPSLERAPTHWQTPHVYTENIGFRGFALTIHPDASTNNHDRDLLLVPAVFICLVFQPEIVILVRGGAGCEAATA